MDTSEKEELKSIVASPGFRGKKLCEALVLLCKAYWAGEDEAITQYDLAQKLYGSTDEEKTVLVRNLISRLRTKLAEYYANNGNGNGLRLTIPVGEYRVEFRAVENGGADPHPPVEAGTENAGSPDEDAISTQPRTSETSSKDLKPHRIDRSEAGPRLQTGHLILLSLSIVVTCIVGYLIWQGAIEKPTSKQPIADMRISGNLVIGSNAQGRDIWIRKFPAHVQSVEELQDSSRFAVFYGGDPSGYDESFYPPSVCIFTNRGEKKADIDLLHEHNPFEGMYSDDWFRFNDALQGDIDQDDITDLVVTINHLYYPAILYVISGRSLACEYAFGNVGHFTEVVLSESPVSHHGTLAIGVLALNNLMAGQHALIYLEFLKNRRHNSPNPELPGPCAFGAYRLIGTRPFTNDSLAFDSRGFLVLNPGREAIRMSSLGVLSSDSCWGNTDVHGSMRGDRVNLQKLVKQAYELAIHGESGPAADLFHQAIDKADDDPTRHWLNMEAARSLASGGDPETALEFLPERFEGLPCPLRFHILMGDIQTLLGNSGEAESSYNVAAAMAAQQCTDSLEGGVHALVLNNARSDEIYEHVKSSYYSELGQSATRAWLLLPALLRGECDVPASDFLMTYDFPELDQSFNIPYSTVYPEEAEIIHSLYGLELGIEPGELPDPDTPLTAECEYGEVFRAKLALVEAVRLEKTHGRMAALESLREAHRNLRALARGNARAVVWSVLAAYHYGFSAIEAGNMDEGLEALRWAQDRYPWGRNADKALTYLQ